MSVPATGFEELWAIPSASCKADGRDGRPRKTFCSCCKYGRKRDRKGVLSDLRTNRRTSGKEFCRKKKKTLHDTSTSACQLREASHPHRDGKSYHREGEERDLLASSGKVKPVEGVRWDKHNAHHGIGLDTGVLEARASIMRKRGGATKTHLHLVQPLGETSSGLDPPVPRRPVASPLLRLPNKNSRTPLSLKGSVKATAPAQTWPGFTYTTAAFAARPLLFLSKKHRPYLSII